MKIKKWFEKNALKCLVVAICFILFHPILELFGAVAYLILFPKPKESKPYISIQNKSGLKHIYNLPSKITFTIWEKEPGMYGSEVLIIPEEHRSNREPKESYIKTKFSTDKPILYFYLYEEYSTKNRFSKNTIFLKSDLDSTFNKGLYEIITVRDSKWDISVYSDSLKNDIFINDSVSKLHRADLSIFSVDIDEHYAEYQVAFSNYCAPTQKTDR